jgi:hypothetical protein
MACDPLTTPDRNDRDGEHADGSDEQQKLGRQIHGRSLSRLMAEPPVTGHAAGSQPTLGRRDRATAGHRSRRCYDERR